MCDYVYLRRFEVYILAQKYGIITGVNELFTFNRTHAPSVQGRYC